uniref:Uncharacterized protein n=1 Tax=Megaselia scalaris TaxID=36166 RepID=T1GP56_MEGSC
MEEKCHEKGILKKHGYTLALGDQIKDKWGDDGQSDNMELMAQQDVSGGVGIGVGGAAASEVERTLKSLNGYHEDILEALRNAASHRGTGAGNTPVGSNSFTNNLNYGEYKRGGSTKSSRENICDANAAHAILIEGVGGLGSSGGMIHQHHHRSQHHLHQAAQQQQQQQQQAPLQQGEDDDAPATGPLRIRNLEDLIRQLEQHSSRHMSPSGSEDIRMSETEADRHYRLDSSAACSESSQGSTQQLAQSQKTATIHPPYGRCRPRPDDENNRFTSPAAVAERHQSTTSTSVAFAPCLRPPYSSFPFPWPLDAWSTFIHHSSHTHLHQDDDAMYESAEHHTLDPRETPDSESDDFIKAQQQLARWASEDVVSVVVLDPGSMSDSQQQLSSLHHHHQSQQPISVQQQQQQTMQQQHQQQQQQLQNTIGHTQQCTAVQSGHILQHHGGDTVSVTTGITQNNMQQQQQQQMQQIQVTTNGINPVQQRDYYPSPPSTTETESSGSVIPPTIQQRRSIILDSNQIQMVGDGQLMENGRYPEYKH